MIHRIHEYVQFALDPLLYLGVLFDLSRSHFSLIEGKWNQIHCISISQLNETIQHGFSMRTEMSVQVLSIGQKLRILRRRLNIGNQDANPSFTKRT